MITIAIPFYRNLALLQRAVRSVQRQSTPSWHLLVSDDGQVEPGAQAWLNQLSDARIQYFPSTTRLGMVGNWNRCLGLAKTPFICLLHSDDELEPTYVATMTDAFEKHPDASAVFCQARIIDSKSEPTFSFPDYYKRFLLPSSSQAFELRGERAITSLIRGNFIFCPTLCYQTARLPGHFDPKWKMVPDLDFTTRILLKGGTLLGVPEVAYSYRRHSGNTSNEHTDSLLRFQEERLLFDQIASQCVELHWNQAAKAARAGTIIRLHLLYRIVADTLKLSPGKAFTKLKFLSQL